MATKTQDRSDDARPEGAVKAIPAAPYWQVMGPDGAPIQSVEQYLKDF